jgi:tetratricopeptide (TPR) repeat protein
MNERTRTILVNGAVMAIVSLFLFGAATQYRQYCQYQRGNAALAAGDHIQAVSGYEAAIQMYTPFSPLVEKAAVKLWTIGEFQEARGDNGKALIAYRALRSAFYAVHGLSQPGRQWIANCDQKIRQLAGPVQPAP